MRAREPCSRHASAGKRSLIRGLACAVAHSSHLTNLCANVLQLDRLRSQTFPDRSAKLLFDDLIAEIYQPVAAFKLRAGRMGDASSGCDASVHGPAVSAFLTLLRSHQG